MAHCMYLGDKLIKKKEGKGADFLKREKWKKVGFLIKYL